ncbi:MAG: methyltransferase [Planctomycetes bacterium]|nr:methyltransferase [Planctomycetota bacterium]
MSESTGEGGVARRDDAAHVLELLGGRCRAQAVSAAAALGLADLLAEGPLTSDALADETGCEPGALRRLLAMLVGLDVLERAGEDAYALTGTGRMLHSTALGPLAAFLGSPEWWTPWAHLAPALRRGARPAFELAFGAGLYEHLARSPEAAQRYDAAIDAFTAQVSQALASTYDFSKARRVLDVGGGCGGALRALLALHPHLHGELVELPEVIARAGTALREEFGERIVLTPQDYFDTLPAGFDTVLLAHVLHNLDDDRAGALLRNVARSLVSGGRLLVVETLMLPGDRPDLARMLDLEMLVLTGGRERRKPEWRRLFGDAGFDLERTLPVAAGSSLLVAAPRG